MYPINKNGFVFHQLVMIKNSRWKLSVFNFDAWIVRWKLTYGVISFMLKIHRISMLNYGHNLHYLMYLLYILHS